MREILEAIVARVPPPGGRRRGAAAGARLRQPLRPVQGRRRLRAPVGRNAARPRAHPLHGHRCRVGDPRARLLPPAAGPDQAARVGRGRLRRHRAEEHPRGAGRRHDDVGRRAAPRRRCPATRSRCRWCSPASTRCAATTIPSCATRSTSCTSTTPASSTSPSRRSRSASDSAAASSACCTWRSRRSASSGSSTSTSSPRAPSVEYRVKVLQPPDEARGRQPGPDAGSRRDRADQRAVGLGAGHHAHRLHRPAHGARHQPPRRVPEHGVPRPEARQPALRDAARRADHRLLRPAQEPIERLREPRLHLHRLPARRPRQARRAGQRRAGRRAQPHRPPVERLSVRQGAGREAEGADPAPDVRSAGPGRHRLAYHQPRDDPGDAQERAGQVLRRRHHAQAQAAREAEGRKAAHEADRVGRDPAGGIPGRAAHERDAPE